MATEPKAGRPSDYMPEVADDICSLLSSGESLLKVCKRPGMPDIGSDEFNRLSRAGIVASLSGMNEYE